MDLYPQALFTAEQAAAGAFLYFVEEDASFLGKLLQLPLFGM